MTIAVIAVATLILILGGIKKTGLPVLLLMWRPLIPGKELLTNTVRRRGMQSEHGKTQILE
jgi:hypothetical protein